MGDVQLNLFRKATIGQRLTARWLYGSTVVTIYLLFLINASAIAILVFFPTVDALQQGEDFKGRGFLFITAGASLAASCYFIYAIYRCVLQERKLRRYISTASKNGTIFSLPERLKMRMAETLLAAAAQMGIKGDDVQFWGSHATSNSPAVMEENRKIHIILPQPFLVYLSSHPDRAAAVVTHELGHVLSGDTIRLPVTTRLLKELRIAFTVSLSLVTLSAAGDIWFQYVNNGPITTELRVGILWTAFPAIQAALLRRARFSMEYSADRAAAMFFNRDALIAALRDLYPSDGKKTQEHPPLTEREARIRGVHGVAV